MKSKFVNETIENEIINHNNGKGLTNTEMLRTANKGCYETFWFSVKGLATKDNPFVIADSYTIAYLDSWATDTTEHYVKIKAKWYYATEKQVGMLFENVLTDDEMRAKISDYHFHTIYDKHFEENVAFVEDTRDGDYIRLGNAGLYEEKDVNWYVNKVGVWVRCGRKEEKILEEIQEHQARLAELEERLLYVI